MLRSKLRCWHLADALRVRHVLTQAAAAAAARSHNISMLRCDPSKRMEQLTSGRLLWV